MERKARILRGRRKNCLGRMEVRVLVGVGVELGMRLVAMAGSGGREVLVRGWSGRWHSRQVRSDQSTLAVEVRNFSLM